METVYPHVANLRGHLAPWSSTITSCGYTPRRVPQAYSRLTRPPATARSIFIALTPRSTRWRMTQTRSIRRRSLQDNIGRWRPLILGAHFPHRSGSFPYFAFSWIDNFCASLSCSFVISFSSTSRYDMDMPQPCVADTLFHAYAVTRFLFTPSPRA